MSFVTDRIIVGTLCYVMRDDTVLLLRRKQPPYEGLWSPPGGKIELGESPEECVIREIVEETGLTIRNPLLRAISTVYDRDWPVHWLLFIYRASEFTGVLHAESAEGELRWISLADLTDYERPLGDQHHWSHVISEKPGIWRGKFTYDTPHTLIDFTTYP